VNCKWHKILFVRLYVCARTHTLTHTYCRLFLYILRVKFFYQNKNDKRSLNMRDSNIKLMKKIVFIANFRFEASIHSPLLSRIVTSKARK